MKLIFVLLAACIAAAMADEETKKACACQMIYKPVCGLDGETYGNECMMDCFGERMLHTGKCEDDDCKCETAEYDPVCGDDGETYMNTCRMECRGVILAHEGSCDK
ncbi:thrombin inhibitor rhodniin-like [Argopecten irradians]|uniref:thrombin inhibitor rhodniin-like n=1 Tax=Argopecten irradians TaxID=31199 RepID=UPI003723E4B1